MHSLTNCKPISSVSPLDPASIPSTSSTIPTKRPATNNDQGAKPMHNGLSRQERKRTKSKAASKANKATNPEIQRAKQERSEMRRQARFERDAAVIRMTANVGDLKATASGFSGSPVDWDKTSRLLSASMMTQTLRSLLPVEYKYE